MPTTKTKRTPAKKKTAKKSKSPQPKSLAWKGFKFTLPAEMPPAILFDMAEIESAGGSGLPALRMLQSFVGAESYRALRAGVNSGDFDLSDLSELFTQIFAKYGVKPGK